MPYAFRPSGGSCTACVNAVGAESVGRIRFTKKGEAFASQTIDCVFELEREAFAPFTQEQWLGYLAMGNAYAKELRRRAELL